MAQKQILLRAYLAKLRRTITRLTTHRFFFSFFEIEIGSRNYGCTRVALKMIHQKCRCVLHTTILLKKFYISAEFLDDEFQYQI